MLALPKISGRGASVLADFVRGLSKTEKYLPQSVSSSLDTKKVKFLLYSYMLPRKHKKAFLPHHQTRYSCLYSCQTVSQEASKTSKRLSKDDRKASLCICPLVISFLIIFKLLKPPLDTKDFFYVKYTSLRYRLRLNFEKKIFLCT